MLNKNKDFCLFIILIGVSFVSVYYTPAEFNRIVFILILYSAYKTKMDYVYFAWFFFLLDAPSMLFSASSLDVDARIPLYPIIAGISVSFQELFIIMYIFKFYERRKSLNFVFYNEFRWYFVIGFFVFLYSFVFGISFDSFVATFRSLLPWAMILVIPAYLNNEVFLVRFSLLIFPFVFIAFSFQIFSYINGIYLDSYLRGMFVDYNLFINSKYIARVINSPFIIYFSIIQAFYFFLKRNIEINSFYLILVIFVGCISVILTATRGWIISLISILLLVFIFFSLSKSIKKIMFLIFISFILINVSFYNFPQLNLQLERTLMRLSSIQLLISGDLTAGGTLQRLDVRMPKVMNKFWESPIIGWGFSNGFQEYKDGHVGHANILLNIGLLGYVFINIIYLKICIKTKKIIQNREVLMKEGRAPLVYLFGLFSIFIIHSSSTQFWGYDMFYSQIPKILLLSFIFSSINIIYLHRKNA